MTIKRSAEGFTRRTLLRRAGTALVATPLIGCGSGKPGGADAAATTADADATTADALADGDASGASADASGDAEVGTPWATGGTAGMKDKARYPNPFEGPVNPACVLMCYAEKGPCYSAQVEHIQDISYGYLGLPARLYFRVLDEGCNPIPGALVDIWHTSPAGKYSGDDPVNENVPFCTGDDPDHKTHLYFRGKQTTDAAGVVFFDSCFPGWYPGRAIHIHFTIRLAGDEQVTSQVFFDDKLNDDILTTQPLYKERGLRDTVNAQDFVAFVASVARYTMETKKMTDGALLAWKALIVRPSTPTKELCEIPFNEGV
jgi:protocatechuate 3,4-dioxygenase beta subunit